MKKTFAIIYVLLLGLAACAPVAPQTPAIPPEPTRTENDACIPPVVEFEFPAEEDRTSSDTLVVPLPAEWEIQATLDTDTRTTLELIEHHPGYDILWLKSDNLFSRQFFLYRTDTKQWENISFDESKGDELFPGHLFQDQNGQVWALQSSLKTSPLFLRLGEDRKFEFVSDVDGMLTTDWDTPETPVIDKDGNFWLVLEQHNDMALYSFNPRTRKAESHLLAKNYEFSRSIALAQDGSIFLLRSEEKEVVQYFPAAKTSRTISLKGVTEGDFVGQQGVVDFFFDRAGRLWLSDYGWLDLTTEYPTWHQIVRSPIFITKNISPFYTYVWNRPVPVLELPDGRILFRAGGGLTWLDPAQGTWCKFTTVEAEVLRDENGSLWLLDNNSLYKYVPAP